MILKRFNRRPAAVGKGIEPHPTAMGVRDLMITITLVCYLCQVTLFGPIRYLLSITGLEFLWYIPDIFGLMCIGVALVKWHAKNSRMLLFLMAIAFYMIEGYMISGSLNAVLSTFKALVPLFCGLLLDRKLITRPIMKKGFILLLVTAVAGVIYSIDGTMPWSGMQFEGIGVAQKFKSIQWQAGGDVRSFGFGGDEHSAASSIATLLILLSFSLSKRSFYLYATVALIGIYFTTSRTNLFILLAYIGLWSVSDIRRAASEQLILRWSLWVSFCAILVPIITIGIALSFSAESVPRPLLSLWIRGTETWLAPFALIEELAPFAMVHGFGLGGVGFGLLQSDLAQYATTIDNFIIFNYLTFGIPYLIFYCYQWRTMLTEHDPYKVMIYISTVIYGLFLRGWSDYLFMILFGYSTSLVFSGPAVKIATNMLHKISGHQSAVNVG